MPSFHVPHAVSRLAAALALLSAAGAAQALDYSGYFRGGPGLTSKTPPAPATTSMKAPAPASPTA